MDTKTEWKKWYCRHQNEKDFWITQLFKIQKEAGVYQELLMAYRKKLMLRSIKDIKEEMIISLKSMTKK